MIATKRYFALFGPRASGKTVYLGALYGSGGDPAGGPAYHVAASEEADDPTHTYLGRISRALTAGAWPDATEFGRRRLEKMTFHFSSGDLAREVVLPDVGGEITRRAVNAADREQMQSALKVSILAEYADYHGFLIFIPAEPVGSSRASEYKWEVDALLNALREGTVDGGMIARPFALLVTKWDHIEPGPLTEGSEARAVAYLEETHPELASGLKVLCRNLRVFPVSATGPTVAGLPPMPLRPTNLGAILTWLIETSERVMLDGAIGYIERNRAGLFGRDDDEQRTCLEVARGRLADFLRDVPQGPLADEARARVEELRRMSRDRLKRRAIVGAAILGVSLFSWLGYRDNAACNQASALLSQSNPELSPREVIARVGKVAHESILTHPVGYALLWWPHLRGNLAKYRDDYESRSFDGLERRSHPTDEKDARDLLHKIDEYLQDFPDSPRFAEIGSFRKSSEAVVRSGAENRLRRDIDEDYKRFRSHPDDYKLAKKLRDKCESFLKDLPATPHMGSVQAIRAEAQASVRTQERARDYAALQFNLKKATDAPLRCSVLCAEFLKNDPSHPRAGEIRQALDRYVRLADDYTWNVVIAFARQNPSSFREQIEKADAYLANVQFITHRDEASRFKRDAIKGFDRASYEAIRTRARDGNHPATLLAVHKLCKDYLNTPMSGRMMADDVKGWVKWFDELTTGKELHVRVAMVRINHGSIWHHYWWNYHDPWVHAIVKVGTKSDRTNSKSIRLGRDVRDLPGDQLGQFRWKWGDPDVIVTLNHSGASPEELIHTFDDGDPFKVRHLDELVSFEGGKITVRLECPEVVPPPLPPYKRD